MAPEEFGQETVRSKAKNAIIFHVHGQGLIISRLINELGIAKTVAKAIEESFKT